MKTEADNVNGGQRRASPRKEICDYLSSRDPVPQIGKRRRVTKKDFWMAVGRM